MDNSRTRLLAPAGAIALLTVTAAFVQLSPTPGYTSASPSQPAAAAGSARSLASPVPAAPSSDRVVTASLGTISDSFTLNGRVGASDEVPLTFRRKALRITFLTAHKASDADMVDWSALTDRQMTVVVYMGVTAAPSVRDGLLAAGRAADTPVGAFARVTRPDAQAAVGTLDQLPDLVAQVDGGPALLIIGDVVAHSAPWRRQNPATLISDLLEAAE